MQDADVKDEEEVAEEAPIHFEQSIYVFIYLVVGEA